MTDFSWVAGWLMLLGGVLAGLLSYDAWLRWRNQLQIPNRWLLDSRGLVTNDEHEVWQWLKRAFHDHEVIVKTPVARYTRARQKNQSKKWFRLLEGIYCTFSICTPDGTVVGCLDVPGKHGLLSSHRDMKESIFTTCGIAYAVVRASNLPSLDAIRAAFIDEIKLINEDAQAPRSDFEQEVSSFADSCKAKLPMAQARQSMHAKLESARGSRESRRAPQKAEAGLVGDAAKGRWENSFMGSSNSRPGTL